MNDFKDLLDKDINENKHFESDYDVLIREEAAYLSKKLYGSNDNFKQSLQNEEEMQKKALEEQKQAEKNAYIIDKVADIEKQNKVNYDLMVSLHEQWVSQKEILANLMKFIYDNKHLSEIEPKPSENKEQEKKQYAELYESFNNLIDVKIKENFDLLEKKFDQFLQKYDKLAVANSDEKEQNEVIEINENETNYVSDQNQLDTFNDLKEDLQAKLRSLENVIDSIKAKFNVIYQEIDHLSAIVDHNESDSNQKPLDQNVLVKQQTTNKALLSLKSKIDNVVNFFKDNLTEFIKIKKVIHSFNYADHSDLKLIFLLDDNIKSLISAFQVINKNIEFIKIDIKNIKEEFGVKTDLQFQKDEVKTPITAVSENKIESESSVEKPNNHHQSSQTEQSQTKTSSFATTNESKDLLDKIKQDISLFYEQINQTQKGAIIEEKKPSLLQKPDPNKKYIIAKKNHAKQGVKKEEETFNYFHLKEFLNHLITNTSDLTNNLYSLKEKITNVEKRIAHIESFDPETLKTTINQVYEENNAEFKTLLAEYIATVNDEVTNIKTDTTNLNDQVDLTKQQLNESKEVLAKLFSQTESLQEQINLTNNHLETLKTAIEDTSKHDEFEAALASLTTHAKTLEDHFTTVQEHVKTLNEKLNIIEENNVAFISEVIKQNELREIKDKENEAAFLNLAELVNVINDEVSELKDKTNSLENLENSSTKEIQNNKALIDNLFVKTNNIHTQIDQVHNHFEELKKTVVNDERFMHLQNVIDHLTNEVNGITHQLLDTRNNVVNLEQGFANFQQTHSELAATIYDELTELKDQNLKFDLVSQYAKDELIKNKNLLDQLFQKTDSTNEQLELVQTNLAALKKAIDQDNRIDDVKNSVGNLLDVINLITDNLSEIKKEVKSLQDNLVNTQALQSEFSSNLHDELFALKAKQENLEVTSEYSKGTIIKNSSLLAILFEKAKAASEQIAYVKNHLETLTTYVEDNSKIDEIKTSVSHLIAETNDISNNLSSLRNQIGLLEENVVNVQSNHAELANQMQKEFAFQKTLNSQKEDNFQKLASFVDHINSEVVDVKDKTENLNTFKELTQVDLLKHKAWLSDLSQKTDHHQSKLSTFKKDLSTLKDELASFGEVENKVIKLDDKLTNVHYNFNNLQEHHFDFENKVKSALEKQNAKNTKTTKDFDKLTTFVDDLNKEVVDVKDQTGHLESLAKIATVDILKNRSQIDNHKSDINNLWNKANQTEKDINYVQTHLDALKQKVDNDKRVEEVNTSVLNLHQKTAKLSDQLNEVNHQIAGLDSHILDVRNDQFAFEKTIQKEFDLQKELNANSALEYQKLSNYVDLVSDDLASVKQKTTLLEENFDFTKNELAQLHQKTDLTNQQIDYVETNLNALKEFVEKDDRIAELKATVSNWYDTSDNLVDHLNSVQNDVSLLNTNLNAIADKQNLFWKEVHKDFADQDSKNKTIASDFSKLTAFVDALNQEVYDTKDKNHSLNSAFESFQSDLSKNQTVLDQLVLKTTLTDTNIDEVQTHLNALKEFVEKDDRVEKLQESVSHLQNDFFNVNENYNSDLTRIKTQVSSLNENITDVFQAQTDFEKSIQKEFDLQKELNDTNAHRFNKLISFTDDLNVELSDLSQNTNELKTDLENTKQSVDLNTFNINKLDQITKATNIDVSNVEAQLNSLKEFIDKDEKVESINQKVIDLSKQNDTLNFNLDNVSEKVVQLNDDLTDLHKYHFDFAHKVDQDLANQKEQNLLNADNLEKLTSFSNELNEALVNTQNEVNAHKVFLSDLTSKTDLTNKEVKSVITDLDNLKTFVESDQRVNELKTTVDALVSNRDQLLNLDHLAEVNSKLDSFDYDLTNLQMNQNEFVANTIQQVDQLKTFEQQAKVDFDKLFGHVDHIGNELISLHHKDDVLDEHIYLTRSEVSDNTKAIETLTQITDQKIDYVQTHLDALKEFIENDDRIDSVNNQVSQLFETTETLKDHFDKTKTKVKSLDKHITTVKKEHNAFVDQVEKEFETYKQWSSLNATSLQKVASFVDEMNVNLYDLNEKTTNLDLNLKATQKDVFKNQSELIQLDQKTASTKNAVENVITDLNALKTFVENDDRIANVKQNVLVLSDKTEGLNQNIETLHKEHAVFKDEVINELASQKELNTFQTDSLNQLTTFTDNLNVTLANLSEKTNHWNDALNETQNEVDLNKEALAKLVYKTNQTNEYVDYVSNNLNNLKEAFENDNRINEVQTDVKTLKETTKNLDTNFDHFNKKYTEFEDQVVNELAYQKELNTFQTNSLDKLITYTDHLNVEVSDLSEKTSDLNNAFNKTAVAVELNQKALFDLVSKTDLTNEELYSVTTDFNALEKEFVDTKENLNTVVEDVLQLTKTNEHLDANLNSISHQVTKLDDNYTNLHNEYNVFEEKVVNELASQKELNTFQTNSLNQLTTFADNLNVALANLSEKTNHWNDALNATQNEVNLNKEALNALLAKTASISHIEENVSDLTNDLISVRHSLNDMSCNTTQLNEDLNTVKNDYLILEDTFSRELNVQKDVVKFNELNLKKLATFVDDLNKEVVETQNKFKDTSKKTNEQFTNVDSHFYQLEEQLKNLSSTTDLLTKDLNDTNTNISHLKTDINELDKTYNQAQNELKQAWSTQNEWNNTTDLNVQKLISYVDDVNFALTNTINKTNLLDERFELTEKDLLQNNATLDNLLKELDHTKNGLSTLVSRFEQLADSVANNKDVETLKTAVLQLNSLSDNFADKFFEIKNRFAVLDENLAHLQNEQLNLLHHQKEKWSNQKRWNHQNEANFNKLVSYVDDLNNAVFDNQITNEKYFAKTNQALIAIDWNKTSISELVYKTDLTNKDLTTLKDDLKKLQDFVDNDHTIDDLKTYFSLELENLDNNIVNLQKDYFSFIDKINSEIATQKLWNDTSEVNLHKLVSYIDEVNKAVVFNSETITHTKDYFETNQQVFKDNLTTVAKQMEVYQNDLVLWKNNFNDKLKESLIQWENQNEKEFFKLAKHIDFLNSELVKNIDQTNTLLNQSALSANEIVHVKKDINQLNEQLLVFDNNLTSLKDYVDSDPRIVANQNEIKNLFDHTDLLHATFNNLKEQVALLDNELNTLQSTHYNFEDEVVKEFDTLKEVNFQNDLTTQKLIYFIDDLNKELAELKQEAALLDEHTKATKINLFEKDTLINLLFDKSEKTNEKVNELLNDLTALKNYVDNDLRIITNKDNITQLFEKTANIVHHIAEVKNDHYIFENKVCNQLEYQKEWNNWSELNYTKLGHFIDSINSIVYDHKESIDQFESDFIKTKTTLKKHSEVLLDLKKNTFDNSQTLVQLSDKLNLLKEFVDNDSRIDDLNKGINTLCYETSDLTYRYKEVQKQLELYDKQFMQISFDQLAFDQKFDESWKKQYQQNAFYESDLLKVAAYIDSVSNELYDLDNKYNLKWDDFDSRLTLHNLELNKLNAHAKSAAGIFKYLLGDFKNLQNNFDSLFEKSTELFSKYDDFSEWVQLTIKQFNNYHLRYDLNFDKLTTFVNDLHSEIVNNKSDLTKVHTDLETLVQTNADFSDRFDWTQNKFAILDESLTKLENEQLAFENKTKQAFDTFKETNKQNANDFSKLVYHVDNLSQTLSEVEEKTNQAHTEILENKTMLDQLDQKTKANNEQVVLVKNNVESLKNYVENDPRIEKLDGSLISLANRTDQLNSDFINRKNEVLQLIQNLDATKNAYDTFVANYHKDKAKEHKNALQKAAEFQKLSDFTNSLNEDLNTLSNQIFNLSETDLALKNETNANKSLINQLFENNQNAQEQIALVKNDLVALQQYIDACKVSEIKNLSDQLNDTLVNFKVLESNNESLKNDLNLILDLIHQYENKQLKTDKELNAFHNQFHQELNQIREQISLTTAKINNLNQKVDANNLELLAKVDDFKSELGSNVSNLKSTDQKLAEEINAISLKVAKLSDFNYFLDQLLGSITFQKALEAKISQMVINNNNYLGDEFKLRFDQLEDKYQEQFNQFDNNIKEMSNWNYNLDNKLNNLTSTLDTHLTNFETYRFENNIVDHIALLENKYKAYFEAQNEAFTKDLNKISENLSLLKIDDSQILAILNQSQAINSLIETKFDNFVAEKLQAWRLEIKEITNQVETKVHKLNEVLVSDLINDKMDQYTNKVFNESISAVYGKLKDVTDKIELHSKEIVENYNKLLSFNNKLETIENLIISQADDQGVLNHERLASLNALKESIDQNKIDVKKVTDFIETNLKDFDFKAQLDQYKKDLATYKKDLYSELLLKIKTDIIEDIKKQKLLLAKTESENVKEESEVTKKANDFFINRVKNILASLDANMSELSVVSKPKESKPTPKETKPLDVTLSDLKAKADQKDQQSDNFDWFYKLELENYQKEIAQNKKDLEKEFAKETKTTDAKKGK